MSDPTVVIIDGEAALTETLCWDLRQHGYTPIVQQWHDDVATTIGDQRPTCIIINVDSTMPPGWSLLGQVQGDGAMRDIPVLVCGEQPVLVQQVVGALRDRSGTVQASSPSGKEVLAKLHAIA